MSAPLPPAYSVFSGHQHLASGPLASVALTYKQALTSNSGPVLLVDNRTGRTADIDIRGTDDELIARLSAAAPAADETAIEAADDATDEPRGRGRPKLGVVPREVTLLPRHWEWLAAQPGGASVALRKLVEDARRAATRTDQTRQARERAYHFMSAIAGDLPGFEEATRALFAHDRAAFATHIASWPRDVREHALALGFADNH